MIIIKIWAVVMLVGIVWVILKKKNLKQVGGTSLVWSTFERALWFDHDKKEYNPKGWGIKIDLVWGKMIRPIPKYWIGGNNPWKGDEPWFVIRIPFMVGIFVSVALGKYGIYLGTKTFQVSKKHRSLGRYGKWMREEEFGTDENPATYLQLSASSRRTRWT